MGYRAVPIIPQAQGNYVRNDMVGLQRVHGGPSVIAQYWQNWNGPGDWQNYSYQNEHRVYIRDNSTNITALYRTPNYRNAAAPIAMSQYQLQTQQSQGV